LTVPDVCINLPPIMAVIRGLFWFALFVFFTFSFVVLFEYGPHNFVNGFKQEFARIKEFVVKESQKQTAPKKK
jgi:hypothetical protein